MSLLSTMFVAAGALYAFFSFYAYLTWLRTREVDILPLGMMSLGLAIVAFSGAASVEFANDISAVLRATQVTHIGLALTVTGWVDFSMRESDGPVRLTRIVYATTFFFVLLTIGGLGVDTGTTRASLRVFEGAGHSLVSTSGLGTAVVVAALVAVLIASWSSVRTARTATDDQARRENRFVAAVVIPTQLANFHDGLYVAGLIESKLLAAFSNLPVMMAIALVFVHRIVRSAATLEQRRAELRRTQKELRSTQKRLVKREELAAVGELSAVIAHEIRNPLAVIKNAVAGLRRPNLGPKDQDTLLEILAEETQRLNRIMHDLLAYARPVRPRRSLLNVDKLLRRVVSRAETDNVQVSFNVPPEARLSGDPELLRRAFVNVVENASHAMPDGGTLAISVMEAFDPAGREAWRILFRDDGHGMDEEVLEKASAPFFTTRPSGTGLGLAIVDRVLRSHEGGLEIESRRGEGTTVSCLLPRQHHPTESTEDGITR